jgi:hypothetical protein
MTCDRRSVLWLLGWLVACGPAPSPVDGGPADAPTDTSLDAGPAPEVCARQSSVVDSEDETVLRCDELFASRPFVRLPASRTEGGLETLYAAFDVELGVVLPTGETLRAVDEAGTPLPFASAPWPERLHWPSARVLVYLYELTGSRTSTTIDGVEQPAFHIVSGRPYVLLPGDVIDSFALGAWEGIIAGRRDVPDGIFTYDLENGARFRVEYGSLEALSLGLVEWDEADVSFAEGSHSTIRGAITNMTTEVLGADGTCIPALSSHPRIPFTDATDGRLDLVRLAAMHIPGDMVLAHEYPSGSAWAAGGGMDALRILHPAAFIQDAEREMWSRYAPWPHGTPDGMRFELVRVSGGGGPCP